MKRLLLSLVLVVAAVVCHGQQKIEAFSLIGKTKKELQELNRRLVFSFDGGYVRPRWGGQSGLYALCPAAEITFYDNRPKWNADIMPMIDAPKGELIYEGQGSEQRGDALFYVLKTPSQDYNISCIGKKDEFIEIVLITAI